MRSTPGMLLSRFVMEAATALATALIGAIVCFGSLEFGIGWGDAGPQPGYFPFYVGLILIIASVINLLMGLLRHRDRRDAFLTAEQARRIVDFFVPMLLFVLISSFLGVYVGMILYLSGVMVFQGGYRLHKAIAVSLSAAVANYFLFEVWFKVPLLKGPLEAFLGIH